MNILIVDDHEAIRKLAAAEIRARRPQELNMGFSDGIFEAGTLRSAQEILAQYSIDAILCDGTFPASSLGGWQAGTDNWIVLAAEARLRQKRFVLLTGEPGLAARAIDLGFAAFEKPTGLRAAIEYLLSDAGGRLPEAEPATGDREPETGQLPDATGFSGSEI